MPHRRVVMSMDIVPADTRGLRACLVCSLVKSLEQFESDGCDNCDMFLHMRANRDRVLDCTSACFHGLIALMCPQDSWVARWQRINRYVPGVYAVSTSGRLPLSIVREMKARGYQ